MSLFASLNSTFTALSAFQSALTVTQNNVSNSSTPGYVKQTQTFDSLPFAQGTGEVGGVEAGAIESSRNQYSDQSVRGANSQLGQFQQQVQSLTDLQGQFNISGSAGIPAGFSDLYSSFSNWANSPNNATARQGIITSAQGVAAAFQQTSASIAQIATNTDAQTSTLVNQVNSLTSQISGYNAQIAASGTVDPSLDASINNALDSLSEIANISTIRSSTGELTVMLAGQTTLVSGKTQNKLAIHQYIPTIPPPTYSPAPPVTQLLDSSGNDVTSKITGGKLAAILNMRNQVLPSIQGSSTQPGSLNQLAKAFADRVNGLLTGGSISNGPPAIPGVPLFSYDTTNATNVAQSLQLASGMTGGQLAAISSGTAPQSNGVALALAGLENSTNAADHVNGQTFTAFFGSMAADVGSQLSSAQSGQTLQSDLVTQAQSLRTQLSGVNLNEEATKVLQYQQSYNAAAKMVGVIDNLTQTVLGLISGSSVA